MDSRIGFEFYFMVICTGALVGWVGALVYESESIGLLVCWFVGLLVSLVAEVAALEVEVDTNSVESGEVSPDVRSFVA